jgi:Ca-activated chloride channel family protein
MTNPNTPLILGHPIFLVIPIALPIVRLIINRFSTRTAVAYAALPDLSDNKKYPVDIRESARRPVLACLSVLTLIFMALGASRPYRVHTVVDEKSRKNLMLVLDVSESMSTPDFLTNQYTISRLEAVQSVVSQFVEQRADDRIGLVVFGNGAFLQAPLTLDHKVILSLLEQLRPGIAGNGTAIGDGLGLGVKRTANLKNESRAIILLTDGANNSGKLNPIEAAKLAQKFGIKVHTIGVGSAAQADFDEDTLKKIATATRGVYFNAQDLNSLRGVYNEISKLESSSEKERQHNYTTEYYWIPALAAILSYGLYQVLLRSVFMVSP